MCEQFIKKPSKNALKPATAQNNLKTVKLYFRRFGGFWDVDLFTQLRDRYYMILSLLSNPSRSVRRFDSFTHNINAIVKQFYLQNR